MTSPVVAVVGGGQLARMMAPAATALGITLRVLVESKEAAAAAPAHQIVVGEPSDPKAIAKLLAKPRPVALTWEHEHIPEAVFTAAEKGGIPALPSLKALTHAQDKIALRAKIDALGLPNPAWRRVESLDEVKSFLASVGGEAVLKLARGGYDGKGVRVISSSKDAKDWVDASKKGGSAVLIEQKIDFDREVSQLIARRPAGEMRAWPLVESIQRNGVCAEVVAPAPKLTDSLKGEAIRIAEIIATALGVTGVLAVEMFEADGQLLVNELAMRPHNSGHWTIDGSVTSQFEQHLRAVMDLPLGNTTPLAPAIAMVNILGGDNEDLEGALPQVKDPSAKIHLYGKDVRKGRKVGHVNVLEMTVRDAVLRARTAAGVIRDGGTDA